MDGWTSDDMPDQTGKVALVTGANSGLGFETSVALAKRGAKVLMAARNSAKLDDAMAGVRSRQADADIEPVSLDLASLASIRSTAAAVLAKHKTIDLLILNAGIMAVPEATTEDGFESQFGTNHLGHFALTGLLLPSMLDQDASRVVVVTSDARRIGRIDFSDLHGRRHYRPWRAYSQSKLANLIFAETLDRRLRAAKAPTIAVAAHPGYAATNLQAGSNRLQTFYFQLGNSLFAQPATAGAWPQLYAATMADVAGGSLYGPGQRGGTQGHPKLLKVEARAIDPETGRRLWDISEQETSVHYNLGD
jgi:NAD(P)-dependent dehydrogenase (short-subunit alcohol dehydrogenase family)